MQPTSNNKNAPKRKSMPPRYAFALEPRLLFDGAAAATAAAAPDLPELSAASDANPPDAIGTLLAAFASIEPKASATASEPVAEAPAILAPIDQRSVEPAANGDRKEAVFIDTSVADYQSLIDSIRPGAEVVLLDADQDGFAQIAAWAQTHTGYDAIHILSYGAEASWRLGTATVSEATLPDYRADLAALGQALATGGDLLLYGCNIAKGSDGLALIYALSQATGADVAASDDVTGRTGDWTLERTTGTIDTAPLALSDYRGTLDTMSASSLVITPTRNDTDAAASSNIVITFPQTIEGGTYGSSSIKVWGSLSGQIGGTFAASGATLTFDPSSDFELGETVTVQLTTAVQSAGAAPLDKAYSSSFTVASSSGGGIFSASASTLGSHNTMSVALGDVDGDGDLDVVQGNQNQAMRIWLNNGSGSFSDSGQALGNHNTISVALGDVDGDGDLDIVQGNNQPTNV